MGDQEFSEVITTYLARESPACRRRAGELIPCGSAAGPRICDRTLPSGSLTRSCHVLSCPIRLQDLRLTFN